MDPIEARLQKCFSKVFPDAGEDRIRSATVDSIPAWDSLASITLLTLVGEEFGIAPDMDRFEEFTSFRGLADYVREETAGS
jgi:acyl carrier protein